MSCKGIGEGRSQTLSPFILIIRGGHCPGAPAKKDGWNRCMTHINVRYQYVQQAVWEETIKMEYVKFANYKRQIRIHIIDIELSLILFN